MRPDIYSNINREPYLESIGQSTAVSSFSDPETHRQAPRLERLNFDDKKQVERRFGDSYVSKRKSLLITGGVILLAVVLGVVVALAVGLADGEGEGNGDFCEEGDQKIRELLKSNFDKALGKENHLIFTGITIRCIPEDAFSALSIAQKGILSNTEILTFSLNQLEKIADRAFIGPELGNVRELEVTQNGITELGDDFLGGLPKLETVALAGNSFKRLNSDIFRNAGVTEIDMNANPLLEVPTAVIGVPGLKTLSFVDCRSMVGFKREIFADVPLSLLDLTNSGLSALFNNVELGQLLDVDEQFIKT